MSGPVQTRVGSGAGPFSMAFTNPVTPGNFLVAYLHSINAIGITFTLSDSVNGAYHNDINDGGAGATPCAIFTFASTASGTPNVTATPSSGTQTIRMILEEWSGVAAASALDQISSGHSSSASATSNATPNTTQANELVLGLVATQASVSCTPTGGYTQGNQDASPRLTSEWLIVSSTGAQTATATLGVSTAWTCLVATYKQVVAIVGQDGIGLIQGFSGPGLRSPFNLNQFRLGPLVYGPAAGASGSGGGTGQKQRRPFQHDQKKGI